MTASLPLVGAQAIILGMAAFKGNARSVDSHLRQMAQAAYYLERTSKRAFDDVGSSFGNLAGTAVRVGAVVVSALAAITAGAITTGQRYGKELAFVGAIGEASTQQMRELNDVNLALSRTSTTTALEMAKLSGELLKAGVPFETITKEAAKAANAMVVASNGELDAARAAGIVSVSLAAFNLKQGDTARAANAATAVVQKSNLTFTSYADALRQGAGVAGQLNLTVEQFAAALGTAGRQITSGTEAGTGLRMMFQRLLDPSKENIARMKEYGISLFDTGGAARPFFDVLKSLEDQFGRGAVTAGKLTEAQRLQALASLFSARAAKTVAALLDEGTQEYLKFLDAVQQTDVLKVAQQIMAATANQLKAIANSVEDVGIAFSQGLDPVINHATGQLLTWLLSIDLDKVREFGRTLSNDLYNAFSSLGVILPQLTPLLRSVINTLAVLAVVPVGVALASWAVALDAWLGGLAFAAAYHVTFAALTVANFAAAAAGVAASFAVMSARAAAWTATIVGQVTIVAAIFAATLVKSLAIATTDIAALLVLQIAAVLRWTAVWVASLGLQAAVLAAHAVGIGITLAVMTAAYAAHGAAAVAASVGIAVVYLSMLAPAIAKYAASAIASMAVATAAFIANAAAAIASAATVARAFAVIAVNALVGMARVAVVATIAAGRAFIINLAGAAITAITSMTLAFGPLLLGVAAIGTAAFLLAKAWANNWGDIQGIVARAVQWILQKLNQFLDMLEQLPLIGEFVGGARAGIGAFFANLPGFVVTASNAVQGFVNETIAGFKSIQNLKLPDFEQFSKELDEVNRRADEARDAAALAAAQRVPSVPAVETEPGAFPGTDDSAKKAAEKLADAVERAKELVRDFNDDVRKETARVANDITKLYADAEQDMAASIDKAAKAINETVQDSVDTIQELSIERAVRADEEERTKALEKSLEEEARIRNIALEEAEVLHDRELEDAERLYGDIQEANRRANDRILEDDAVRRDITRAEEDRAFDRVQRDEERVEEKKRDIREKALRDAHDLRERELGDRQDQEERALAKIHDANEDALRARLDTEERLLKDAQDRREQTLRDQLDAEARLREEAKDLGEITRKDTEARAEAEAKYAQELAIGVKQSIAQARLNEKLKTIAEDTAQARGAFERRKTEAALDLEFERAQEQKLATLRAEFDAEDVARKTQTDNAISQLRETNENAMLALRAEHEKQMVALRRNTEEEMTRLRETFERERDEITDRLEKAALDRSRDREREDRQFAEQQEEAKRTFAEKQEKEALDETRRRQDVERLRRRDLDVQETNFRKLQEQARDTLSKQFADEEHQRKLTNIRLEHDKRIAQIEATLSEEQEKTRQKLAQDITDLNQNLKERIDTIRSQYVDRLEDIRRAGGAAISGMADDIESDIVASLDNITEAANNAVAALAEALGASEKLAIAQANIEAARGQPGGGGEGGGGAVLRPGGKPGETAAEVENFLANERRAAAENAARAAALAGIPGIGAAVEIAKVLGFQYGGTVPGPYGQPVLVRAHGGEEFAGLGGSGVAMTAVRMAEAMYRRGTQGSPVTNNYDYTVNANYGRVQPEGSVRLDMSALVTQTRR